jgi:hypothetical protein
MAIVNMDMTRKAQWLVVFGLVMVVLAGAGAETRAQPSDRAADALPPAEVLRLLDGYAIMRAQEMLGLTDQQYGPFVQHFKQLLDVRRRHLQTRTRLIGELQRATRPEATPDEATLRKGLSELRDLDLQARDEVAQAMAAVDGALTLRQQVRFRVFEELLERRKLELMARARSARRSGPPR